MLYAAARTLTVQKTGTGTGTVMSDVGKVDCGATCADSYPDGTAVILTATAAIPGSVFSGWRGGGCSGTDACRVILTAGSRLLRTST